LFFFMDEKCSIVYVYPIFFIHYQLLGI
jgi:hypothetical protein